MRKFILLGAILVVVFFVFLFLVEEGDYKVCFDGRDICFDVDIADDSFERGRGLMDVEYLGDKEGMLFVYDASGDYSFWMKNTLIALDMLWIDENFEVVHIENAVPCEEIECVSYSSPLGAKYILEINSGFSERYGIKVGDKVRID